VPGGATDFKIGEIVAKDRLVEAQSARHPVRRRREFERAGLVLELDVEEPVGLGDPADLVQKIHVPRGAAELAVGDPLEAELGLHIGGPADAIILDPAQRLGGDPALLMLGPRRQQRRRPQQAADMIGAERGIYLGHVRLAFTS